MVGNEILGETRDIPFVMPTDIEKGGFVGQKLPPQIQTTFLETRRSVSWQILIQTRMMIAKILALLQVVKYSGN